MIECSGYVTGSNFSGFYEYPLDDLYDITFGIAEVDKEGVCVVTKHDAKNGFVNEDVVKCQFLYELQGNIYLNSDVKSILDGVQIKAEGKNRYVEFTPRNVLQKHRYKVINLFLASEYGESKVHRHHLLPNWPFSMPQATNPKLS